MNMEWKRKLKLLRHYRPRLLGLAHGMEEWIAAVVSINFPIINSFPFFHSLLSTSKFKAPGAA